MFSLKLLGGAVIEGPDGPLTGRIAQRRRLALLCVLALSRDRPVSRDKLLALFWPESGTERARHSLADSLYHIRRELGESAVLAAGDELRLNREVVWSDVGEFEAALEGREPLRAVAAYTGPLVDGFHLGDAPEFERWVDAERERLARMYAKTLEQLAEDASVRDDVAGAVEWWRRLAAEEPHNSRFTLRLMQALESAGERAGAIQQARVHATLLEQEFGAEPEPAVAALAERMRAEPTVAASRASHVLAPVPATAAAVGFPGAGGTAPSTAADPPAVRPAGRNAGWKTIGLLTAAALVFGFVLSVRSLLPEPSSNQDRGTEAFAAATKTIAVLPFTNLSRDPEEEYFSDGLTDELIGVLSQVRALQVVARTSAFAFKGENRDIREIGRALNVGAVLEGSVRKEGDRVRVMAQLINSSNGFHLWSDTYEREGMDIFAIQSDLALRIASALEAELTAAEQERITRRPTMQPGAYALYLKGRHFWNERSVGGLARASEYFERAIDADPRYAAAYAGLATAYALRGILGYLAPREARERMREAALKAIELDDDLAEAHTALGAYLHHYEWDWDAAEREHRRAIQLDPSSSMARTFYGAELAAMGRLEEALTQRRKAVELDPLAPVISENLGSTLLRAGRPDEALEHLQNAVELDSMYWRGHASLALLYETTGRFEEALKVQERAVQLAPASPNARIGLARILALAGREHEARHMLAELQAEAGQTGNYLPAIATVLAALEDSDGALAWLELSYRQRHPQLRFMGDPSYARLERDPRYADLLRRVGLRH